MTHRTDGFATRLRRDRRGAVFVIGAFGILLTGAASMFAVDLARLQLARVRLQTAADAAALAAARDLGQKPASALAAVATAVFEANMTQAARDVSATLHAPCFRKLDDEDKETPVEKVACGDLEPTSDVVRVAATATLPLLSNAAARALGWTDGADGGGGGPLTFPDATLAVVAEAHQRTAGAEIMMVLDNTGSMNGQPIKDLRDAARTLTEAVFAGRESVPDVYMGLVNYSATVNIGRQHAHWLAASATVDDAYEAAGTRWKGCVLVRSPALAETDAPPDIAGVKAAVKAPFKPQFWPSSRLPTTPPTWDKWYLANSSHRNIWPPGDAKDPARIDATKPKVDERQSAGNNGYGPNLGCPAPITPLVSSRAAILNAIDGKNGVAGIEAWHRGGTFGNVGLAWGWRSLSPDWRGLWRNAAGVANPALPLAYDTPFHNKIIVMMTDGVNQHHQTDVTAYGRPEDMPKGFNIDESMKTLCANIKKQGIILFTITFGGKTSGAAPTYKACASPETLQKMPGQKYFHAPTGAELVSVFGRIAGQISELRLVR
jgi:hypothetical protein